MISDFFEKPLQRYILKRAAWQRASDCHRQNALAKLLQCNLYGTRQLSIHLNQYRSAHGNLESTCTHNPRFLESGDFRRTDRDSLVLRREFSTPQRQDILRLADRLHRVAESSSCLPLSRRQFSGSVLMLLLLI